MRPLRVFLCHSSNDKPAVRELYKKLRAEPWIQPWLDEEELYPGQDWNMEIEKAVEAADAIIVCLSKGSITKEGYVQKEIRAALDYADYKPEGTLFIIPVRLEECTPPKRLGRWQYADYFEGQRERGFGRLLVSLKKRSESLDLKIGAGEELVLKLPTEVSTFTIKNVQFMKVSSGKFIMGSDEIEHAKPQSVVDIPYDYWMAHTPITNEQYNMYVNARGMKHPVINWEAKKNHPVDNVQWGGAVDYCNWLNELMKGDIPFGLVFRLPTEAEWEKAARSVDGRQYPWGNDFGGKCNSKESDNGGTTPVGEYSPYGDSPYGCTDMAGNVWEWTHSIEKKYPYDPSDGREGEDLDASRIIRGGAYFNYYWGVYSAYRVWSKPDGLWDGLGFRIVASIPLSKLRSNNST